MLCTSSAVAAAQDRFEPDSWQLLATARTEAADSIVSANGFSADEWHPVTLPSTVLNALVEDGTYPDPRVGMNNFLIPDVSEEGSPWRDPWWYRSEFRFPKIRKGELVWLNLDGINYRADVWLNGRQIASADTIVGMFRRFRFNVTDLIRPGRENTLAIKIHQVDHPGTPSPGTQFILFGPNRGQASDIWRDETLKMSGGWDCAPVVRDRNMGIYHPIYFTVTGPATFADPHITTTLPAGDTLTARVAVTVPVVNNSGRPLTGTLSVRLSSVEEIDFVTYKKKASRLIKPVTLKKEIMVAPGDTAVATFAADIDNPPLWWPNGYGEQPMQRAVVTFSPKGAPSTVWADDFAIREVKAHLMEREYTTHAGADTEYGLYYTVNGRRIFARGGWLQPDILLNNSRRNVYDQARLIAGLGANIVGSEDMPAPGEDWLDAFDKYGLMYWHVFHQCYRMFPGRESQNNPDDHSLAIAHVRDEISRYRNHPSLIAWVGVNEVLPAEDLYEATKAAVRELDPSRHYIPTTSVSWDVEKLTPWLKSDLPIGTTDDGAPDYAWAPSDYYFDKIDEVYTQMFKNELGMPAPPVYENLRKFIPTIDKPFDVRDRLWPLDSVWAEHGAWCANNFVYRGFDNAIRTFYSDPESASDYALKAQLLGADGYRAMIEAANHRAWDITTGVMLWKLNSCWPDVAWQVYDWYLTPNAAYYFTRKAMEQLHLQLNANTETVSIINHYDKPVGPLVAEARITDFFLKDQWIRRDTLTASPESYRELFRLPNPGRLAAVYLVTLTLSDLDGNQISRNTYWRYSQHPNFYWLLRMQPGTLSCDTDVRRIGDEYEVDVTLKCGDDGCVFFKHLTISDSPDGPSIDPVFWSDNFVTLLPGETMKLKARFAADLLPEGREPVVRIDYQSRK
ncbi:MAG: glycoside hydrolase family 2 [Muribaculaceae bacterium]|nr:glycoside hydrolase family 2 [Muribaculaceae bacterium]